MRWSVTFCKTGGGTHTIPQKKGTKKGKNSVSVLKEFFPCKIAFNIVKLHEAHSVLSAKKFFK